MQYTPDCLLDAIDALLKNKLAGTLPGDVIVDSENLKLVERLAGFARATNQKARDLPRLAKTAAKTQDAANPRPLSTLLTNLIHTVMATGGNPAYQQSAAVRLVLHQMLWLLDGSSLPAYDRNPGIWEKDMKLCHEVAEAVELAKIVVESKMGRITPETKILRG